MKSITAKQDILSLYHQMMSIYFKEQGADKTKQTKEIQSQIEKLKLRLQNAQALMLDGELSAAEYKDIRNTLSPEIESLERKKVSILTSEDDYQRYLDEGIPLLQNIDKHWLAADLAGKQHIVGSIFPGKLVFEQNTYRTVEENPVLRLIALPGVDLSNSKKGKVSTIANLSY